MRTLRTVAAACLAAGLLTACTSTGSTGGASDNKPGGAAAASGSAAAGGSAGATGSAAPGSAAQGGAAKPAPKEALLASAAVMEKAGSAKVTVTPGDGNGSGGTGEYVWKNPPSFLLNTEIDGQQGKILFVADAMYLGAPAELATLAGGKNWMKLDPRDAVTGVPGSTDIVPFATMMQLMDPGVQLVAAAPTATLVGPETVAGQATVHYRSEVQVDTLVGAMKLTPELKTKVNAQLKASGASAVTDYWINAKGELVQQSSTDLATTKTDKPSTVVYSALGTVQATKAPSASEVFNLGDILK
ncbi:hypothetical protein AB0K51_06325 [Kitasatospora sp. NPDC049285]|uniref:hypothetical protein n=1 Tax=Kitasatospora sp. NPDC049285 TaxID=3157096 RepID=UPI003433A828